jgi:zinc protease
MMNSSLSRRVMSAFLSIAFVIGFGAAAGRAQSLRNATGGGAAAVDQSLVTEFDVNGLKVLVKRRSGSQSVVAGMFFRGGSSNITAANAGIEALMLDAATEASQKYPLGEMRRELARTGSAVSFGVNPDYSVISLSSTKRFLPRSWDVFAESVLHPSFTQADFDRVKARAIVSRQGISDTPDTYLDRLQSDVAYPGHPYLNDPRGTEQSLGSITVDAVRAYHKQMMQASRLLLVVVGDVDPNDIRQKVASSFATLPKGTYTPKAVTATSYPNSTVTITPRDLPTNYIQGVYSAPAMTSPDIYAMRVATSILQERVYSEVRVKRNLSYAPDAFLRSQGANLGGVYVTAVDANQSVQVILAEIKRLQTTELDPADIRNTAQQFLTRYYLGQETNAAQAGELAQFELIGGGWRNANQFLEHIRSVTPADVRRVANQYMKNIQFVVLGNPSSINKSIFVGNL